MRYLILLVLIFSCQNDNDKVYNIQNGLIKKKGIYYSKDCKITIKEFSNGSLVFGVSDKQNKLYFQQSILEAFDKNSLWCLYIDDNGSLWFFNSDYNNTDVWIKDELSTHYIKKDFCENTMELPDEFEKFLLKKTENICINIEQ